MLTVIADHWTTLIFHVVIGALCQISFTIRSTHISNHMTMDENFNTMHAHIVCSTDDDNDDAHHAPTAFNHAASNANNITDTSIVLVTFPLLNIGDQREDEDFIVPDGHANPLPEGFSRVAPGTTVDFCRHVDTALTPPTTKDYTGIPVVMHECDSRRAIQLTPPPPPIPGLVVVAGDLHQADQFLLALLLGFQWMTLFVNASLQTHTLPPTPALIMRLMLPQKIEDC
jgi:hypothetical protein